MSLAERLQPVREPHRPEQQGGGGAAHCHTGTEARSTATEDSSSHSRALRTDVRGTDRRGAARPARCRLAWSRTSTPCLQFHCSKVAACGNLSLRRGWWNSEELELYSKRATVFRCRHNRQVRRLCDVKLLMHKNTSKVRFLTLQFHRTRKIVCNFYVVDD